VKASALIEEHRENLLSGEAMYDEAAEALERFGAHEELSVGRECFRRYRLLCERYQETANETRFAPFHLIATEGRSYFNESRLWHLERLCELCRVAGPPFEPVPYFHLRTEMPSEVEEVTAWWQESASIVVKTLPSAPRGHRGSAQPGFLCRNSEHLRLVYGPEYDRIENRLWLSERPALMRRRDKSRRVTKELALSIEAVERFVAGRPIESVEECIRAIASTAQSESSRRESIASS
jgi:protein phosphatase